MPSKTETLDKIVNELGQFTGLVTDRQASGALEKIFDRLIEAKNYFEEEEDRTGQRCTSRMVGIFLLKTWRMTKSRDFNKLIVKKMPRHFRKITILFDKIDSLSEEVLGYDYKNIKKGEERMDKIFPFLRESKKAFLRAAEREEDADKSAFLSSVAEDFHILEMIIFTGKDENGGLVSNKQIIEKTTEIWTKIANKDWKEFISDDLHNPIYGLKATNDKFPTMMDPFLERKFIPQKSKARKSDDEGSIKMKEDVVHIEFSKSKRKPLQKRGTLAARKGGLAAKKGGFGAKKGGLGAKGAKGTGKKKLSVKGGKAVPPRKNRPHLARPKESPTVAAEAPATAGVPPAATTAAPSAATVGVPPATTPSAVGQKVTDRVPVIAGKPGVQAASKAPGMKIQAKAAAPASRPAAPAQAPLKKTPSAAKPLETPATAKPTKVPIQAKPTTAPPALTAAPGKAAPVPSPPQQKQVTKKPEAASPLLPKKGVAGTKKPGGRTWLTADSAKKAAPPKPKPPVGKVAGEAPPAATAKPASQAKPPAAPPVIEEKVSSVPSKAAPPEPPVEKPIEPAIQKAEVEKPETVRDEEKVEAGARDEKKKKGCLPFVIGITCLLILFIYLVSFLR